MDTELIVEFIELAKHLNATETAKILNMSQPMLSKHISTLEKTLRFPLFVRSPNGFSLTRFGVELLPYAYELIEKQDAFLEKCATLKNNPLPRLTIGGVVNLDATIMALGRLIDEMGPKYGTSFIELKYAHHKTSFEMLEDNSVDFIFAFTESDQLKEWTNMDSVLVHKSPMIAMMSKTNPLAGRKSLSITDLKESTLIRMEGTHMTEAWSCIQCACEKNGFTPEYRRQYSMRQIDLLTISANLGNDILILGGNFAKQIIDGSTLFSKMVPIIDPEAYIPISAVFRMDNPNPILPDALDLIAVNDPNADPDWENEFAWLRDKTETND